MHMILNQDQHSNQRIFNDGDNISMKTRDFKLLFYTSAL